MAIDFKALLNKSWTPRVVCGIFLLFLLIELSWGLHSYFFPPFKQLQTISQQTPIIKESIPISREDILKFSLFGDYLPEDLAGIEISTSTLHLKLVGIVYSPDEKKTEVILQFPEGNQDIVHVGDNILGGVIIKKVTPNEVYLFRNGKIEYLFFPEKDIKFDPPAPPLLGD